MKNSVFTRINFSRIIFLTTMFLCGNLVNAQDKLYANKFPLSDVALLEGPFQHARDLNIQTLLKYDVDRLLAGYRKEAGLPAKAKIYPNWEGLDWPCWRALFNSTGNELCCYKKCRM